MSAPRFYIITNDVAWAALDLWCHPGNVPSWLCITDNLDVWNAIPDGAGYRCHWNGTASQLEGWRNCWDMRKSRGGIEPISEEEWAKIEAWCEEHRKWPSLRLLTGEEPEVADDNAGNAGGDADLPAKISVPEIDVAPSSGVALRPSPPAIDPPDRLPNACASSASKPAASPNPTLNPQAETVKRKAKWS